MPATGKIKLIEKKGFVTTKKGQAAGAADNT